MSGFFTISSRNTLEPFRGIREGFHGFEICVIGFKAFSDAFQKVCGAFQRDSRTPWSY